MFLLYIATLQWGILCGALFIGIQTLANTLTAYFLGQVWKNRISPVITAIMPLFIYHFMASIFSYFNLSMPIFLQGNYLLNIPFTNIPFIWIPQQPLAFFFFFMMACVTYGMLSAYLQIKYPRIYRSCYGSNL